MKHLYLVLIVLFAASCIEEGDPIDQVQTNLVDKAIFEGEWWHTRTVVDVDTDEAYIAGTFEGDSGWADPGVDGGQSGTLARIRWVIDENYLFAYRAYELIEGGNDDGRADAFRGQPLAVYRIEAHVDVRQSYNPVTGELTNVRVENTADRRWYERQFMRVDWSQNLVTPFYDIASVDAVYGDRRREPVPFFFQEGAHEGEFPDSWRPQFVRIGDDATYRFRDEWPTGTEETVHYMSFVNQEVHSPGTACLTNTRLPCQSVAVTVRNAFLRVPPEHQYPVATQSHEEFDRFGLFRTYQRTYVRGGLDRETLADHCETDDDCGVGGACDLEHKVCTGGLTSDYGETDFLTFYRPRHNFWKRSLTPATCLADWQCDDRYADAPPGFQGVGSVCDRAARRCTIPLEYREIREVTYHLDAGYPAHLVQTAFEIVGGWNEAFMRGQRATKQQLLPESPPVACQSDDPTAYCYCDGNFLAAEVDRAARTCPWRYDPFVKPSDAEEAGVIDPYNCYVRVPDGVTLPKRPVAYEDYGRGVFGLEFAHEPERGPSECMLVLRANSCDRDPSLPCEELGDLRYQFFNYVDHANTQFGGVSALRVDPTTGELITANANMAGWTLESIATTALEFFPVLRGEAGAEERYFSGENLRGYYDRLGQTEHPPNVAPSGTDGFSTSDPSRPGISGRPTMSHEDRLAYLEARSDRVERLHGPEARAMLFDQRMQNLAGTAIESRLVGAMGDQGADAITRHFDPRLVPDGASIDDDAVLDRVSPFRGNFLGSLLEDRARVDRLAKHNVDPVNGRIFDSRFWQYWADAFRSRPLAEASIRMQQAHLRAVMFHEMGHSVGLRHNFAASLDRDQYHRGYFNILLGNPDDPADDFLVPESTDFDADRSGSLDDRETFQYERALREHRDELARRGIGNVSASSTMDYHGDLSDFSGLGTYDVAATIWNYFDRVEAYVGDPRLRASGSLNNLRRGDVPRTWWRSYRGGESCSEDFECPYSYGRVPESQPVSQRCIRNPRLARVAGACNGDRSCVCSSFTEDFLDYTAGLGGYENDLDDNGDVDYFPVDYLFCTDDRVNDISWCNRFDAGDSFTEVLDHFRRGFEETYPRRYHRAFRRGCIYGDPNCEGSLGFGSVGSVIDAAKIYQHLYFRYFYEPGFSTDRGPLGIDNQFDASIAAMNWFAELVNLPDTGSYRFDARSGRYRRIDAQIDAPGADISLGIGQGFPMWSTYQEGHYGFYRTEESGVFYDKYFALMALSLRDWGLSYSLDERFFINFYDLFQVEMTEFFGGMIAGDPTSFAPRVAQRGEIFDVQHVDLYRNCGSSGCGRESLPAAYDSPALESTSNTVLRDWATILALATFPVFYDTSFEQRLSVFKRESGDGFRIPATQPDGSATCAYGGVALEPEHTTTCGAGEHDYVVYSSRRLHSQYIAVKVRPRLEYNLDEEQLGFNLLRSMVDTQSRIEQLEMERDAGTLNDEEADELARRSDELTESESFLEYLIEIQRAYGISSWL